MITVYVVLNRSRAVYGVYRSRKNASYAARNIGGTYSAWLLLPKRKETKGEK